MDGTLNEPSAQRALLRLLKIPTERCREAVIRLEIGRPIEVDATYYSGAVMEEELETFVQTFEVTALPHPPKEEEKDEHSE